MKVVISHLEEWRITSLPYVLRKGTSHLPDPRKPREELKIELVRESANVMVLNKPLFAGECKKIDVW
jgi:hypothetical protein